VKRRFLAFLSALTFSVLVPVSAASAPTFRFGQPADGTVFGTSSLFMEQQIDGKRSGRDMVVSISVERSGEGYTVNWDAVNIHPIELGGGATRTSLRAVHYGTDAGTIRNVVVKERFIAFDIVRAHGDMKVEISRTGDRGQEIVIRAYRVRFSNKRQKTVNEEWVMTESIRLPSRDLLGWPEKKPKAR
jgi:hypothetical protein